MLNQIDPFKREIFKQSDIRHNIDFFNEPPKPKKQKYKPRPKPAKKPKEEKLIQIPASVEMTESEIEAKYYPAEEKGLILA